MKAQKAVFCTICGEPHRAGDAWFLLTENRWTDRLKILGWNEQLVGQPGAYPACGAAHIQQLVVHWMTTGSLGHPFPRGLPTKMPRARRKRQLEVSVDTPEVDTRAAEIIGELAVHRESLSRILIESPESLASTLEALINAVSKDRRSTPLGEDSEEYAYELMEV